MLMDLCTAIHPPLPPTYPLHDPFLRSPTTPVSLGPRPVVPLRPPPIPRHHRLHELRCLPEPTRSSSTLLLADLSMNIRLPSRRRILRPTRSASSTPRVS